MLQYKIKQLKQQGVALIATLMVVIIVAVLGVTVINRTLSAKKNDNSLRDMEAACLAAESALRLGEADALDPYANGGWVVFDNAVSAGGASWYKEDKNWVSGAISNLQTINGFSTVSGGVSLLSGDPMYRLELVKEQPYELSGFSGPKVNVLLFRVTAMGIGRSPTASCKRQSVVRVVASQFENDE